MIEILLNLCSLGKGKSGMGLPLSSKKELVENIFAKSFALSDEDEITSGYFMIVRTDALPILKI